tara:strand:+ start:428 stop:640 length:213 start_codon:yes stop_codon:yes gene_type:complete
MKIKANTAIKKIKAGTAWVDGKMSDGHHDPDGEEYWVITDGARMQTNHVLVSDAPDLMIIQEFVVMKPTR